MTYVKIYKDKAGSRRDAVRKISNNDSNVYRNNEKALKVIEK